MKKYLCILVCAMFMLTATFGQALAADMRDAAWDQPADLFTKVKVQKEGKDESYDPVLFSVWYYDVAPYTTGYLFLYSLSDAVNLARGELVMEKGKKILFTLDGDGYQDLANALAQWLYEISLEEGFVITNPIVYFTFIIPKPYKMKVDKDTGDLIKKTNMKLKGWVEAEIDYVWYERKFNLKAKGIFY